MENEKTLTKLNCLDIQQGYSVKKRLLAAWKSKKRMRMNLFKITEELLIDLSENNAIL